MASKNIMIKKKVKTRPLYSLDKNFTQIANTMFKYIPNGNTFKIYVYLCYRYNRNYQYAFPSMNTIASDTMLSLSTVQRSLRWLEEKRFIVKYQRKESEWMNNCYYVKYVIEDDVDEIQNEIIQSLEEIIGDELEIEEEIELYVDENGKLID